jgi:transposase
VQGIVGLDIGSDSVSVCVLSPTGQELGKRHEVPNSEAGAVQLLTALVTLLDAQQWDGVRIGLEASGIYWWPLAVRLSTATELKASAVYPINPKPIHDFRATLGRAVKSDRADAHLIAQWVRFGHQLPAPFAVDWRYEPLRRLTRLRVHLAHTLSREKTYFLTMLFLPFSGFVQAGAIGDPFGPTGSALLAEFTTEQLTAMPIDELAAYLQRHGRNQFADATATATTLQRAARDSYRLHAALADPLRLVLATTRATITTLQDQLKAVDRTIARELGGITQTVGTVPGLGPVLTAGLVAEIGDIRRFTDEAALAQYAGLTWTVHESGHFQADDTHLTKQGNRYLRYYLVEGANSVREHCAEYRTYYRAKYAQSPTHPHKRAVVLTARKLVRLVDVLLRTGMPYQAPEDRKPRKEGTAPHARRPGRHHHTRPAATTT